jgi:hypothetical protein
MAYSMKEFMFIPLRPRETASKEILRFRQTTKPTSSKERESFLHFDRLCHAIHPGLFPLPLPVETGRNWPKWKEFA